MKNSKKAPPKHTVVSVQPISRFEQTPTSVARMTRSCALMLVISVSLQAEIFAVIAIAQDVIEQCGFHFAKKTVEDGDRGLEEKIYTKMN